MIFGLIKYVITGEQIKKRKYTVRNNIERKYHCRKYHQGRFQWEVHVWVKETIITKSCDVTESGSKETPRKIKNEVER